ncbi:IS630 family transposase [Dehalococcoidia bacterium]|nr:IS630 family transposase [Dehalococcoidia bacterium]
MPFISQRAKIKLSEKELIMLKETSCSRTESIAKVQRSQILLAYYEGKTVSSIARHQHTNRPKVERCLNKALECGVMTALNDLPRQGRTPSITPEAKAWVISIACTKPKDVGYASELWTMKTLAKHIREHCRERGYLCLSNLARGTVSKILSKSEIKPHKISYYVERKDPQFETKMVQVLRTYKQVEILKERLANGEEQIIAVLSYDAKPGIQAIGNIAPDLPPVPETHPCIGRDSQYKRHGTVSLLAAIDLLSGHVHGIVRDRHRSIVFKWKYKLDEISVSSTS